MRNERPHLIESVDNALRLLLLVRERRALRVADAAEHLGVARSTAHRLLTGLRHRGFLTQDARRVYHAGPVFTRTAEPDLRLLALPHLRELRETLDETVHLTGLEGNGVRFVDVIPGTKPSPVASRPGVILPAHCTASGLVLLAELPAEEVADLYPLGLPFVPGAAATDLPALFRRLRAVRRSGYAHNYQESAAGLAAVAVPIRAPDGHVPASLAVAMRSFRCPRPRAAELATILRAHAEAITTSL